MGKMLYLKIQQISNKCQPTCNMSPPSHSEDEASHLHVCLHTPEETGISC